MLNQAITQCPEDLWADTKFNNQFWQIAYHALFYAHLYLQPTEEDFIPWQKHNENYHSFEALSSASTDESTVLVYKKDEVLEYLEVCRQEVDNQVAALNLEAESGFPWIPFNKQELQFYNIRHLQHHTGELCERLGTLTGIEIKWVGMMKIEE
jgi:hypothetical protein